jgi:hypothetical protein
LWTGGIVNDFAAKSRGSDPRDLGHNVGVRGAAIFLLAAFTALALAATGPASSARLGSLRVVTTTPFTVAGSGFHLRERIRLTATIGTKTRSVQIRATRLGTFRVLLDQIPFTRCDVIRVVATGFAGTTAVLKRLPAPACIAQRSGG